MSEVADSAAAIAETIPYATARPERGPDRGRDDVVREAFEHEPLDEMAAAGPDGTSNAHLGAALRGEHHEDQEDQQDARPRSRTCRTS